MHQVQALRSIASFTPAYQESTLPFKLIIAYLLLDFGRPQEIIPGLSFLHLPGIAMVLLAYHVLISGGFSLSSRQSVLFAGLLGLMAVHIPLATNTFYAFNLTWSMTLQFCVFSGIMLFVNSVERIKSFAKALLGIHVYLALHAIFMGGRGVGGFLGDENDLCMTLVMVLPFAFFLGLKENNPRKKLWYFLAAGLLLAGIVATSSRGGFIGLMAVGVYCWIRSPRKGVALAAVGLLVVAMLVIAPPSYWDEMSTIKKGSENSTGEDRIYEWEIGWSMFLHNPIIGVGQGNFPFEFRTYEIKAGYLEGLHGRSRAGRAAHSLYFTLIPELGLVGLYIFLSLLNHSRKELVAVRRSLQTEETDVAPGDRETVRYLTFALEGSFAGFLVSSVFISTLYYPNYWLLIAFAVALRKVVVREPAYSFAPN